MQALDQIRVVEIGPGVAISFAGKLFADFGADVIKVEEPDGDPSRRSGPFPADQPDPERSAAFGFFNRNKRGVTLAAAAAGTAATLLADLAATADLVLAALSLRELAELGLSLDALAARHPGIVLASLTPWGEDGPYAGFAATQLVADAIARPGQRQRHAAAPAAVQAHEPDRGPGRQRAGVSVAGRRAGVPPQRGSAAGPGVRD